VLASNVSGRRGGLKIALHAQSKSSLHGWVAGSEITTRGLRRALLKRTDVSIVEIFAPFCYEGIANYKWDILLVEGFSGPVHSVIRGLRQFNKHIAVLHWCLDTYPALASVAAIDVDGFLTNSRLLALHGFTMAGNVLGLASPWFYKADLASPRDFVALAVDAREMMTQDIENVTHNDTVVVYLGQPSYNKALLAKTLLAITRVPGIRLKIYGSAWDHFSLQDKDYARLAACCWQGRLPSGSIARLYANATIILGTTDSSQRRLGMVNNRVFEALACSGGQFVAVEEPGVDFFSELRGAISSHGVVTYTTTDGVKTITDALVAYHSSSTLLRRVATKARVHAIRRHTYDTRAATILSVAARHYNSVRLQKPRTGRPIVTILVDGGDIVDWEFIYGLLPALLAHDHEWQLRVIDASTMDFNAIAGSALVVARGPWGGVAMRLVSALDDFAACATRGGIRGMPRRPVTAISLQHARSPVLPVGINCKEVLRFDAIFHYSIAAKLPVCLEHHPNVRVALGVNVAALHKDWFCSTTGSCAGTANGRENYKAREPWGYNKNAAPKQETECLDWYSFANWNRGKHIRPYRHRCVHVERLMRAEALPAVLRSGQPLGLLFSPPSDTATFLYLASLAVGAVIRAPGDNTSLLNVLSLDPKVLADHFCLEALTNVLVNTLVWTLDSPRSIADLEIMAPGEEETLVCNHDVQHLGSIWKCSILVTVSLKSFVPPDDGVWCVHVNEIELVCQGDTKELVRADFEFDLEGITTYTVRVCAVLRSPNADLGRLSVVRRSRSVSLMLTI